MLQLFDRSLFVLTGYTLPPPKGWKIEGKLNENTTKKEVLSRVWRREDTNAPIFTIKRVQYILRVWGQWFLCPAVRPELSNPQQTGHTFHSVPARTP
jgi:hypothetical protein